MTAVQTILLFFFHLVAFHSDSLEENEAMHLRTLMCCYLEFHFREMKDCSIIMKNSSRFFMGPTFNFCFHEAAVHIYKLIILIGPPVCRMEMYGDLFFTITILQTRVYMASFVL